MKILLSIKPEFSQKIFSGEKLFEYRKREFKCQFPIEVIVYESSPTMMVVGKFIANSQIMGNPQAIWKKTKKNSGISAEFYNQYFENRNFGIALEIVSAEKFKKPKKLEKLTGSSKPPQSYQYLK